MASILVLDDEAAVTRLLTLILRTEGFHVSQASNGREGLRILSQSQPDLIILDLQMPVMDGRAFYHAARAGGYKGPVVVCSANDAEAVRLELGAEGALGKPFDPIVLLSIITGLLILKPGEGTGKRARVARDYGSKAARYSTRVRSRAVGQRTTPN